MTAKECADYLGVALSTVRAWTSRRRLPVVKLHGGRACRYRRADLEKLVKQWSRPALAEAAGDE